MSRKKYGINDTADSSEEEVDREMEDFKIMDHDAALDAEGFGGYQRKRRKFTKEDAMLGIFADRSDDDFSDRPSWTKGVSFVSGGLKESATNEEDAYSSDEDHDRLVRTGGLGFGESSSRRAAFASSGPADTPSPGSDASMETLRTMQFGNKRNKPRLPNKRLGNGVTRDGSATPPVEKDFAAFSRHTKGFGLKMLQKMGWREGQGLGSSGEGIARPIEVQLRPEKVGIGFGSTKERAKSSLAEERRRRGGKVSGDENEGEHFVSVRPKANAWKKTAGATKAKIKYKTAEEIMQEADQQPEIAPQVRIIDMTGPEARELGSVSEIRSQWMAPETMTRLPELRHNLRLIVDMSQADLENFTREKRIQAERVKFMEMERDRLQASISNEARKIKRTAELKNLAKECERISKLAQSAVAPSMDLFEEPFSQIITNYMEEYESYHLDSLVISVMAPMVKQMLANWEPLKDPSLALDIFQKWRVLLRTNPPTPILNDPLGMDLDEVPGRQRDAQLMTPFESMMYSIWLPKIRSAINNEWDIRDFEPVITLLECWQPPLLPVFIYENILDQLVMPKLTREVNNWEPRREQNIDRWLHPWLPILEDRMEPLYAIIRHKLSVYLQNWHPSDTKALSILRPWHTVFQPADFELLLIKAIMPRLASVLRDEFRINPRKQDLEPLKWVLAWQELVSPVLLAQLLENEMFPQWLQILQTWLAHHPNFEEVTQWYQWWRELIPQALREQPGLAEQFKKALDMMNASLAGNL
ncbi:uncharacterized protein VTP21DRAFT_9450 [Calcarisporiella thermophila]|uniref:uncharacterized protein n=1 Tax=Calcarisporiella thermophila TaxID=911321 RepID=UPI00374336BB